MTDAKRPEGFDARGTYLQHKFVMTLAGHLDAPGVTLAQLWDLATVLVDDVQELDKRVATR